MRRSENIRPLGQKKINDNMNGRLKTKLKLELDSESKQLVGFVSCNVKTGRVNGVRRDQPVPKMIVVLERGLQSVAMPNILYDAEIVPMRHKNGYIAVSLTPTQFEAQIESVYIPGQVYRASVKYGNSSVVFDPLRDVKYSLPDVKSCVRLLEKKSEIADLESVVAQFVSLCERLEELRESDMAVSPKPRCGVKVTHIGKPIGGTQSCA